MTIRDSVEWTHGYLQGRLYALPHNPSQLYGQLLSKATRILTVPLPFASFLILPFFGGSPATINFLIFYLTWASFVATHGQFQVEIRGTLLVRLVCFLGPALGSLIFDASLPSASKKMKAKGERHMPRTLGRKRLTGIVSVATVNVLLGVALQAVLEYVATRMLHVRSLIKVTAAVPLPWTIIKDVVKGILIRGTLRYAIHRFWLHTYQAPLKTWHLQWQHSIKLPFALVAAYDHPLSYLLSIWAPAFVPAVIFRYHVLSWHILLAVDSLLDLSIHSGYAVLPSSIIIPGMARRIDAHFEAVSKGSNAGKFGTLGFLD
ncbi:hypothetical protein EJ03DRAFT_314819 [Teratosphaeria nubilosa]|uniref:Fatty acid hydroxylase domain-containing protein n=1 Tax=Teratosphaeria nubilosa TaxID=161662 RepID=A0A6G1L4W0_9PEZI|nr:hypothetical protein EJ03DRAFT_314819 [Teratosphaeria nubilosa]